MGKFDNGQLELESSALKSEKTARYTFPEVQSTCDTAGTLACQCTSVTLFNSIYDMKAGSVMVIGFFPLHHHLDADIGHGGTGGLQTRLHDGFLPYLAFRFEINV